MSWPTVFQTPTFWVNLLKKCKDRIDNHPLGEEVWSKVEALPLVDCYCNVVQVMKESLAYTTVGRFAVFIRWLHRHELSYAYWRQLAHEYPQLLTGVICQLSLSSS